MNSDFRHPPAFLGLLRAGYRALGVRGRLLLAVSGGRDSTALLEGTALLAVGSEELAAPAVCCVDHGLRPQSAGEAEQVRQRAEALGLAAAVVRVALPAGPGVEARARQLRYAALEQARVELGCDWVVTAHTLEDQAETLILRLGRGASLRGARGIHARRERIARPMLGISRAEVRSFLAQRGAPFVEDPMNRDPHYARVRVRGGVLPAIATALGEGALRNLAAFAAEAAEDAAALDQQAQLAWTRLRHREGLDRVGLLALEPAIRRRVVALLLVAEGAEVDREKVGRVLEAIARRAPVGIGGGLELRSAGGLVRSAPAAAPGGPAVGDPSARLPTLIVPAGAVVRDELRGWTYALGATPASPGLSYPVAPSAALPLQVRSRRPGDRLDGGPGRRRKLQDLLVDAKVPRELRSALPIVEDQAGNILCVVGLWSAPVEGPSHFFTAAPSERQIPPLYAAGDFGKTKPGQNS